MKGGLSKTSGTGEVPTKTLAKTVVVCCRLTLSRAVGDSERLQQRAPAAELGKWGTWRCTQLWGLGWQDAADHPEDRLEIITETLRSLCRSCHSCNVTCFGWYFVITLYSARPQPSGEERPLLVCSCTMPNV